MLKRHKREETNALSLQAPLFGHIVIHILFEFAENILRVELLHERGSYSSLNLSEKNEGKITFLEAINNAKYANSHKDLLILHVQLKLDSVTKIIDSDYVFGTIFLAT